MKEKQNQPPRLTSWYDLTAVRIPVQPAFRSITGLAILKKHLQFADKKKAMTFNSWFSLVRCCLSAVCCFGALCGLKLQAQEIPHRTSLPTSDIAQPAVLLPPLTVEGKCRYYVKTTFSWESLLGSASMAGIAQWRDHPSEWGQGMKGYGHRLGSRFGQHGINRTIQFGVAVLRQEDPRKFPSKHAGEWPRLKDAVVHTFVVPMDSGKQSFAVGRVAGCFGGGLISRTWHPEGHKGLRNGLQSGAIALGTEVGLSIFQEFWPDIKKLFRR